MPNTYTLISSNVLSSSAASVTFSAIPSTYTDLVLRISARQYRGDGTQVQFFNVRLNSAATTSFSSTFMRGIDTTVQSFRNSSQADFSYNKTMVDASTSNTFSFNEIYIPNYASTASTKPVSGVSSAIQNSTNSESSAYAGLYNSTNAVTAIVISGASGLYEFVSGSSFYLYGIKNS